MVSRDEKGFYFLSAKGTDKCPEAMGVRRRLRRHR